MQRLRFTLCALCLTSLLTQSFVSAEQKSDTSFKPLFNGKNLDGWFIKKTTEDKDKTFWTVEKSAITARAKGGQGGAWLISNEEYSDFELKIKVQSYKSSPGNSGIQIRSRFDQSKEYINGPQVDIHPPYPWRSGLLYDETTDVQRWLFPEGLWEDLEEEQEEHDENSEEESVEQEEENDGPNPEDIAPPGLPQIDWFYGDKKDLWNDIRIICKGTSITTYVNGVKLTDFDGKGILDDKIHKKYNVGMKGHIALQLHAEDELLMRYKGIEIREIK